MLYIIRHGKTDWNVKRLLQGRTDIPLNEEGREMARAAAKEYKDIHFDLCFSSPLVRATETAELLLKGRNIPIITDDRLIEMGFGCCEGKSGYEETDLPIKVFFQHPEEYSVPVEGGESLDDLYVRTGAFLDEKVYPLLEEGKDVLIVGHGAMNSSIICQVKDIPRKDFWSMGIPNCKLFTLL